MKPAKERVSTYIDGDEVWADGDHTLTEIVRGDNRPTITILEDEEIGSYKYEVNHRIVFVDVNSPETYWALEYSTQYEHGLVSVERPYAVVSQERVIRTWVKA